MPYTAEFGFFYQSVLYRSLQTGFKLESDAYQPDELDEAVYDLENQQRTRRRVEDIDKPDGVYLRVPVHVNQKPTREHLCYKVRPSLVAVDSTIFPIRMCF